ncbi:MAG: uroporphyrinogen-III synthase, partial [Lachnospiraceae bacterium]|nr:uroporphyrinogen-III synthase [Lachnospiraceae bacterium]MDY5742037.1 uroporphyrinogen-III synthase [Lachnospiraceae bacterium]
QNGLGVRADLVAVRSNGQSLGEELAGILAPGAAVLLAGAKQRGSGLSRSLMNRTDIHVTEWATYRTTVATQPHTFLQEQAANGRIDAVVLTSSSTVRGMRALFGAELLQRLTGFCIGEQTAETAKGLFAHCLMAAEADLDGLMELITDTWNK